MPPVWSGAIFQMVAHGVISAGLFMIVGLIYVRTHTRELSDLGGLGAPYAGDLLFRPDHNACGAGIAIAGGIAADAPPYFSVISL